MTLFSMSYGFVYNYDCQQSSSNFTKKKKNKTNHLFIGDISIQQTQNQTFKEKTLLINQNIIYRFYKIRLIIKMLLFEMLTKGLKI